MTHVTLYTAIGTKKGAITLPESVFGRAENPVLLAQAIRVYQWRQHLRRGKTKTRGDVSFSTTKLWRQKGTGRARHGARSAPIFVGGGIAHGPRGIRVKKRLPQKLTQAALATALSTQLAQKAVVFIDAEAVEPKTSVVATLMEKLGVGNKPFLILHAGERGLALGSRNLKNVHLLRADRANAYEVVRFPRLVITKQGVELLRKTFGREATVTQGKRSKKQS